MKFFKKWPFAFATGLIAISLAYATVTYVQSFKVGGSYVWILESNGATTQTAAQKFGSSVTGSAITMPTTTTGANFSTWVPVYNVGAALTQGDVLIASNTGTGYVMKQPGTTGLTTVVGAAAEAIASGATGWMIPRGGQYAIVKTTGTVAIGDTLVSTSSAAGYAGGSATPTTGTDFGTAMSAGTAAGGTVLAILH